MKFKGSKKIVSLFLAVLMVVSSVPAFALSASAATNTTDVSALETAMHSYEDTMKNGDIMTNMKAAYDAYVNAQKAIDAIKYGYSTSINVSAVANNLTDATNKMSPWTSYKGTMRSKFSGDKDYLDDYYYNITYQNILYADETASSAGEAKVQTYKDWASNLSTIGKFTYSSVVMLYDNETAPQTGVMFTSTPKKDSTWGTAQAAEYAAWMSANNGGLKLTLDKWKGWDTNDNFQYIVNGCGDTLSTSDSTSYKTDAHKNAVRYGNYITFDASNDPFNGEIVKTYTPTWSFYTTIGDKNDPRKGEVSTSKTIQIFNYKAVIDAINSTKSTIANVANYKQGGLSTLFSDIESLMKDPNSFFTENGARKNGIDSCSSYYSGVITNTKRDLNSVTADDARYQTLRKAITDADTVSTAKTADSLVAYGKTISAARNVFANDVATRGYDSPDVAQTKATALNDAKSALANVDTDDAYSNFDAAVKVVNAMDKDAFKNQDEVTNQINSAKAKVYKTLTDSADIEAYTLATGVAPTADLKNSTSVDTVTTDLLNFANEPSADLIKDVAVTFGAQIQKDNNDPATAGETNNTYKYGTMVTFDADSFANVSALGDNKSIKWIVNYTDGTISKFATNTTTITIKATKGMTVTANVIDETPNAEATNYTVKLYNIYNNVVDYDYVSEPLTAGFHEGSSIDVNGKSWTIDIPFYTLTGFDVAVYESSKTITVKPHYDAVNTVSVNVINGSATGNKLTDNSAVKSSSVYINTDVDNFYAWANIKGDKYQIISYNKDYGYAAISDGNYTPVVKENGTYYVYTSDSDKTLLKASMIDQFKNNSDYKLSDDNYLFTKLNNYAPFTYIEDDSQSADGKYRVFIRITSGSNDEYKNAFDSFGVYGYGSKIPFTTVNEISGQYTFTSSVLPSDFNAYVSYKMTYTDKTGSYNITTTDFAKNA